MGKRWLSNFTALLLGAWFLAGCTGGKLVWLQSTSQVTPTPPPAANPSEQDAPPEVITAEGDVVPAEYVTLSFNTLIGVVEEVLVKEGQRVQAGQVLARLSGIETLSASVASAETELLAAQQGLDDLYKNHDLRLSLAQQSIATADKVLDSANDRLDNLLATADQADIDAAHAEMIIAKDRLDKAEHDFEPYRKKAEDNVLRAMFESKLAAAQNIYDAKVSRYNNVRGGVNQLEKAIAEADVAVAESRLKQARQDFADLQSGPPADEVEMAESLVQNAEAQLAAAKTALDDSELKAPFSGTVVNLDIKVGQALTNSKTTLQLADLDRWQVETTDLQENDLGYIQTGMPVRITLDAFPGQEFTGVVSQIDLLGIEDRGAATYTITIDLDLGKASARWGMTAQVEIDVGKSGS